MASEKILESKKAQVAAMTELFKNAKSIVLVDYKGISVADDTKLRSELREEGVKYSVLKNSILAFAAQEVGLDEMLPALNGTTAVAVGDDEVAPARVIQKYASKNKNFFNFKVGYVDGKFMDAAGLQAIASLPSRDGLIAQVAGSLNGIIASLARAVNEVAKKSA